MNMDEFPQLDSTDSTIRFASPISMANVRFLIQHLPKHTKVLKHSLELWPTITCHSPLSLRQQKLAIDFSPTHTIFGTSHKCICSIVLTSVRFGLFPHQHRVAVLLTPAVLCCGAWHFMG